MFLLGLHRIKHMPSRRLFCGAVMGLLGSGCAFQAPYQAPTAPPAAAAPFLSARQAPVSPQPLPDDWWRLYRDPTLDSLIAQALRQNRELAVAAAHVAQARAIVDEAGATELPQTQLALAGNYGKQNPDQIVASARHTTADTRWAYAPSLTVSYEVDVWGRVRQLVAAAQADADATQAAADAVRVVVVASTTDAYTRACSYGAQIDVAQRALDVAGRLLGLTDLQRERGLVSDLEAVRARDVLDQTRATLPVLQGQRRAALLELAALLGQTPDAIPAAAAQCRVLPELAQAFPVGDGAAMLRRRPDLRAAERRLAAADATVAVALADLYPSITLGASVALLSTSGSVASLGDQHALTWGVGPLISWNFPNLRGGRARVAQARAANTAARAQFDSDVLNALKESEQALTYYGAQWQRRQALQEARVNDARAVQLAELNYRAGALSELEVLDAERRLLGADAALAVSAGTLVAGQIAVFQALGGGWRQAR